MILISETSHGSGASLEKWLKQRRPSMSVRLVDDLRKIEAEICSLGPGDIFIADLVEMEPRGVFEASDAVRVITRLEDELLPKGASAILLDTQVFAYQQRVAETIELCMGRIELISSPARAEVLLEAIDRLSTAK